MFIYNWGASAIGLVWPTTLPPKKFPEEVIDQLRSIVSSEDGNLFLAEQIELLFKNESYDFLKSAIQDLVSKVKTEEDLVLLEHFLKYLDTVPISIETEEFETDVCEFKAQIEEQLRSHKMNLPFDVDGEHGDKEFCLQLEKSADALVEASIFQIKSALVYFSLKNSTIPFIHALIQCAKTREISFDFKSNRRSILGLLTQKISEYPCTDSQIELLELLLND